MGKDVAEADGRGPDLYDEIEGPFAVSALIYELTAIRKFVRSKELKGPNVETLMNVPVPVMDIIKELDVHKDFLKQHMRSKDYDLYMNQLGRSMEALEKDPDLRKKLEGKTMVAFEDPEDSGGIVYEIILDKVRKEIIVCFRGSADPEDFLIDANMILTRVANPANISKNRPNLPAHVGVHRGFKDYLCGREAHDPDHPVVGEKLLEDVAKLMEENPDFRLFCTGHSLGAALAVLFAFGAAGGNDPRIRKPVSCVTFASPKVGNNDFFDSFKALEDEGVLRSLRVKNDRDPVTRMPIGSHSGVYIPLITRRLYCHVGNRLVLYPNGQAEIRCNGRLITVSEGKSKNRSPIWCSCGSASEAVDVMSQLEGPVKYHACAEYQRRLTLAAEDLKKIYWNDLYGKKS